jgi:formylglycine-generating enzyme required for sulfatase activity
MRRSRRLCHIQGIVTGIFLALSPCGCEALVKLEHFDDGCPPGRHGPTSVRIDASAGSYCVDSTEVTNAQYQEFLGAVAAPGVAASLAVRQACAGQTDFTPRDDNGNAVQFAPGQEDFPVTQVSWCDAFAYCVWAGKRMCGQIGGGPLAEGASEKQPALAQWYGACSRGGTLVYPYGNAFNPMICGGMGAGAGSPIGPVALRAGCVGGYPGIHDMSGSVWEWNDVCDTSDPGSFCKSYGGAYDSVGPQELSCIETPRPWRRNAGMLNIGIRCCEDLP